MEYSATRTKCEYHVRNAQISLFALAKKYHCDTVAISLLKKRAAARFVLVCRLFEQIVVNDRIRCRGFVNPTFVEVFSKLAVGDDKFEFHKSGDVVVDTHNHRVGAVCIFGIIAKIRLAFFETHAVFTGVLHDFVTDRRRNTGEEQRKATYAVLGDVEHFALGQTIDEVCVKKFGKILLAFHIRKPIVVRRADVQKGGFGKGNRHFVEYEKNNKFLNLAIKRLIRAECVLNVFHIPSCDKKCRQ